MQIQMTHNFVNSTVEYQIITSSQPTDETESAPADETKPDQIAESQLPTWDQLLPVTEELRQTLRQIEPIALFSAMDHRLHQHAIVQFQSYLSQNPGRFEPFIITRDQPTPAIKKLGEGIGLQWILLDQSEAFPVNRDWPYPSECFWNFIGPEIFNRMGYRYSMSVDPDTECLQPLDWDWLPQLTQLAGAPKLDQQLLRGEGKWRPQLAQEFIDRLVPDRSYQQLGTLQPNQLALNPGVLLYNNQWWSQQGVNQQLIQLFNWAKGHNLPIRGDDSLLNLWLLLNPIQPLLLSPNWNWYYHRPHQQPNPSVQILHMHQHKPWGPPAPDHYLEARQEEYSRTLNWLQAQAGAPPPQPWWWRPPTGHNWGDELTPWILHQLTGIHYPAPPAESHPNQLLAVGSIFRLAGPHTQVWGSGIRDRQQQDFQPPSRVHAVRGPLTHQNLTRLGIPAPPIWGDPALLLPLLYNPKPKPIHPLGIVPHVVDLAEAQARWGHLNIPIIDLNTPDTPRVIDQIRQCRAILSSSLHGLIAPIAYGIPARHLLLSDRIKGDGTKFLDFQLSLEPPQPDHQPQWDLTPPTRIRPIPPLLQAQLLGALPHPLREALRARTPKKIIK